MNTKKLIRSLLLVMFLGCMQSSFSQTVDENLWGTWELQSGTQTSSGNNQTRNTVEIQPQAMLKQKTGLPEDLFLLLYFFDNNIGVCSTNGPIEFLNINDKGTFYTEGNQLVVTLNRKEPVTYPFTYSVKDDELTLHYNVSGTGEGTFERNLIFKLKK